MASIQSMPYVNGQGSSNGIEGLTRHELAPTTSPSSVHFALPRTTSPPPAAASSYRSPSTSPSTSVNSIAGPSRNQHAYTPSQLKQSTTPTAVGKLKRTRSESTAATLGGYETTTDEDESQGELEAPAHVHSRPTSPSKGKDRRHSALVSNAHPSSSSLSRPTLPSSSSFSSSSSSRQRSRPLPQPHSRLPNSSPQISSSTNRKRAHTSASPASWSGLQPSSMEFVSREQQQPALSRQSGESGRHPRASSNSARPSSSGRISAQPSQDRLSHNGSIPHPRRTREPSSEGISRVSHPPREKPKSSRHREESRSSGNEGRVGVPRSESRASRDVKGKGRAREHHTSRSGFEAGLSGASQQQHLDSEQLASLVSSIDINGALRIISDQKLTLPRSTSSNQRASLQFQAKPTPTTHQEPILIRAPPPLVPRERADSIATQSTIQTSPVFARQRQVSLSQSIHKRRDSFSVPTPLARARAGSTVITEDGGHVPFTHHARQASVSVSLSSDESVDEVVVPSRPADPPLKQMLVQGVESTVRKKGLSLLFKRQTKDKVETPVVKPAHVTKSQKAVQPELSEEQLLEMRRRQEIEHERMEVEAAQERTQATLSVLHQHPQAERAAYEARAHVQAYYNLLFDGIATQEYVNPLLIIRWAYRRDQQVESRAKWEADDRARHRVFADILHSSPVSIPARGRKSNDGGREYSEHSARHRGTIETPLTATTSLVSSTRHVQQRNRWKWTLDDAQAFRDCKGQVDFFVPPHRDYEPDTEGSGFLHANGERDGRGDSSRSLKSASTGPDMSSMGDLHETRRMNGAALTHGDSDLSRSASQETPEQRPAKLVKPPPLRHESADEAPDKEAQGVRHRHGHHARAIVEHIKNAIPGRHDDGSASETDRGERSGFSPRAFAHGLRPFRGASETIPNGSAPGHHDDASSPVVNGVSKAPSTRAKVALAIRNRAHPKPSMERMNKPIVEHVDDVESLNAVDYAVEPSIADSVGKNTSIPSERTQLVPDVHIQDEAVDGVYELRKQRLERARRDVASFNEIPATLDTSAQQLAAQISLLKKSTEVSAGFKAEWPKFDALELLERPLAEDAELHPEAGDTLAPLQRRVSLLSGTDSDRSQRRSQGRWRIMNAQPLISARAAPRRISLAPAEPVMLDPISRLEAVVAYVSEQLRDFARSTAETQAYQISIRTKMKGVEAKAASHEVAARASAQEIKELERQRGKAAREARSQFEIRWRHYVDIWGNVLFRAGLRSFVRVVMFFVDFPCLFGFRRVGEDSEWKFAPGWELVKTVCFIPVATMVLVGALYYYGDD